MPETTEGDKQRSPDEDTEMENLPETQPYQPPVEANSEEDIAIPSQIAFPQDIEESGAEWDEWDNYPLEIEKSAQHRRQQ